MSLTVKTEPESYFDWDTAIGVSEAAECSKLYEGHQVKDEVVVGPDVLQPRDVSYSYDASLKELKDAIVRKGTSDTVQRQKAEVVVSDLPHLVTFKHETASATHSSTQDSIQSFYFDTMLHRQAEYSIKTIEQINENKHRFTKAKKAYICNTCSKHFLERKAFIEHIKKHTGQNRACGKKSTVKKSLKQHEIILTEQSYAIKKNSPRKASCRICNKTYSKRYMYRHRLTHTGEKPFSCDICLKQFKFKDALYNHLQEHSGKPNTCHLCHKAYTNASSFRSHMQTHTNKKFKCEICNKTLSRERYLIAHYALHTGEKTFKCETCGSNFATKRQLTYHKLVHTEKSFCCDVCGKQLSDKSYLARHLRRHAGYNPKPHSCDICGFKFTTTTRLTIHKRIHTGEKPFSCKICAKQFRHKSTLTSHMRGHTGDNQ